MRVQTAQSRLSPAAIAADAPAAKAPSSLARERPRSTSHIRVPVIDGDSEKLARNEALAPFVIPVAGQPAPVTPLSVSPSAFSAALLNVADVSENSAGGVVGVTVVSDDAVPDRSNVH